jgi:hypothetical protein
MDYGMYATSMILCSIQYYYQCSGSGTGSIIICTDSDPDPSIKRQKNLENLDLDCFVKSE